MRLYICLLLLLAGSVLAQGSPAERISQGLEDVAAGHFTNARKGLQEAVDDAGPDLDAGLLGAALVGLMRSNEALGDSKAARAWGARLFLAVPAAFVPLQVLSDPQADDTLHALRAGLQLLCLHSGKTEGLVYLHNATTKELRLVSAGSRFVVRGYAPHHQPDAQRDFDGAPAFAADDLVLPAGGGVILKGGALGRETTPVALLAWRARNLRPAGRQPSDVRHLSVAELDVQFARIEWGEALLRDVTLLSDRGPAKVRARVVYVTAEEIPVLMFPDGTSGPGAALSVGSSDLVERAQSVLFSGPEGALPGLGRVVAVQQDVCFCAPQEAAELPTIASESWIYRSVDAEAEALAAEIVSVAADEGVCVVGLDAGTLAPPGRVCAVFRAGRAYANLVVEAQLEEGRLRCRVLARCEGWELELGDRLAPRD